VDCTEFNFKHALLREDTYETVFQRDRPNLHAAAAAWFEAIADQRIAEYRDVIAFHLELAGDLTGAARHLLQAGLAAEKVANFSAALRTLTRALDLWDAANVDADPTLYGPLSRVLRLTGRVDDAQDVVTRGLGNPLMTTAELARIYYHSSAIASMRMDRDEERLDLDRARALVPDDDLGTRSDIETGTGWLLAMLGDSAGGAAAAQRALHLATTAGDARRAARAESVLGIAATAVDDLHGALHHAERELALALETGDLSQVASGYGHAGVVHHLLGDGGDADHYYSAMRCYECQVDLYRNLGAYPSVIYGLVNLAQLKLRMGHDAGVRRLLAESVKLPSGATPAADLLRLQVEADRRLANGDLAGGLAILGRTRRLPIYGPNDEDETQRILSRVTAPTDDIDRLIASGAHLDLEGVLAEIAAGEDRST
jgi:tetratricopeptide (TPR) repeat protein